MSALRVLPLEAQLFALLAIGTAVLIVLALAFFIVPALWRFGQELVEEVLDARMVRDGATVDRLPSPRARLDAATRFGADVSRVRCLSERVAGVGPVDVVARGNGRPTAAKGWTR